MSQEDHAELGQLRQEKEEFRKQYDDASAAVVLERVRTLPEDQALILFHRLRGTGAGHDAVSLLQGMAKFPSLLGGKSLLTNS